MLKLGHPLQHPLRHTARQIAAFGAFAALSMHVLAAPEAAVSPAAAASSGDAISRFLHDAGLVGPVTLTVAPPEGALVERVRDRASDMVLTAMNFLGVPYKRGGISAEHGFDCSGFTRQVFEASLGLILPRRADEQAKAPGLIAIKRDELQPGDLVFFNTLRRTFSHVGIYVGDGKFIHSPRAGGEVRVEDMRFAYWAKRYNGARRADPIADPATADAPSAALTVLAPARAVR